MNPLLPEAARDIQELRPRLEPNGTSWISTDGGERISKIAALFSKGQWAALDEMVEKQIRYRAPLTWKLMQEGLYFNTEKGIKQMALSHEPIDESEIEKFKEATSNLDGLESKEVSSEIPIYRLSGLPLPITHHNCYIEPSKFDSEPAGLSARRVAEKIEDTLLGLGKPQEFIKQEIFGLLNHRKRLRAETLDEAINALWNRNYYGPYILCQDNPRLNAKLVIPKVVDGKEIGLQVEIVGSPMMRDRAALFQATPDVIRVVIGQSIIPVQWPSDDGKTNVKVLAIVVPQLRVDMSENLGVVEIGG